MEREELLSSILDSNPYRLVFVDTDNIIRYMNKEAKNFYYNLRGHKNLIGKSLLNCHKDATNQNLLAAIEEIKSTGKEKFVGVNSDNVRLYITPIKNKDDDFIGYYARYEQNIQL